MMTRTDFIISLDFDKHSACLAHEEPDDFLYQYDGKIIGRDDDRTIQIGQFKAIYADIMNGLEAGLNPLETLDGLASTNQFSPLFSKSHHDYSETVQALCDYELLSLDLLIIDRLEILPCYRGQGIGAEVVKGLIRRFGHGAALAAIKAFPLQLEVGYLTDASVEAWRQSMGYNTMEKNKIKAKTSLKSFYKRLGFKNVPKTDLMIANLSIKLP